MSGFSIVLVSDTYPPVIGGSELEAQRISAALIRRGHRVTVLTSGGEPMPAVREWADPEGVPVKILTRSARGLSKNFLFAWQVARELWRERRNYQIVYFLMQGLHLAAGLPVARAAGKTIVMKFGGSGVISAMRRSHTGRLELAWLRKWAARLMVLNDGMMQEAAEYGFPHEQMLWMPNPVNTEEFCPATKEEAAALRRDFNIPENAWVVIYVGRLAREKGLPALMRGFAIAAADAPEAMLVLVGGGPMRSELEGLARELGIESRVRFAGRVESRDVPLWLRASDVFALTSPSEGFSCALAEAMSAGLASVTTRIPANEQLVECGVEGLAVPVDDEAAIARALAQLFRDPEMRRRMGSAARKRIVESFSTAKVADRYEQLFAEATAGARR